MSRNNEPTGLSGESRTSESEGLRNDGLRRKRTSLRLSLGLSLRYPSIFVSYCIRFFPSHSVRVSGRVVFSLLL